MNQDSASFLRAIKGPVILITVGTLFALDSFTGLSFSRTWPVLLVVMGLLSLGKRSCRKDPFRGKYQYRVQWGPPRPPAPPPAANPAPPPAASAPAGPGGYRGSTYEGVPGSPPRPQEPGVETMRRSLSGPVTIIAVGVLFLLNNFYPDVFTFHSLFRLWPFLLIGLGVIRLLEVLLDAARSKPLAPSHFSFVGVVMLALVCLLFWGISKGARTAWHGLPAYRLDLESARMFGNEFDFDVQQSLPVTAADTRLVLEGLKGSVSVSGDDMNNATSAVSVTGHRIIHAFGQGAADQANRRIRFEVVRNGTDIVVRSTGSAELSIAYDLDIRIPRRMNLADQAGADNVTVESLDGGVDLASDTGNVRLSSIGGDVRVETIRRKDLVRAVGIKGKLDLRGTGTDLQIEDVAGPVTIQGNYYGTLDFRNLAKPLHFESEQTDLRLEKLPGSISMDLGDFRAENVTGPLRLRCESRDVHISDFSSDLDVSIGRGDIEVNPQRTPLGNIEVHDRAGDIVLTLPGKLPFDLHANTDQGDVDNQYGDGVSTNSEGRSASMSAAGGGPTVTLTTGRGDITLKKN